MSSPRAATVPAAVALAAVAVMACGGTGRPDHGTRPEPAGGQPAAPASPEPIAGRDHRVRITEQHTLAAFTPYQTNVNVGDTVTWANETSSTCSLESDVDELPPGTGGSSAIRAGKTYTVTFTRDYVAGAAQPFVTVKCHEHPEAGGVVSVQ